MRYQRSIIYSTLLIILALALSACGPRAYSGFRVDGDEGQLVVDLPALVIDVDSTGQLSLGEIPLAQLAGAAGMADLESLEIPPEMVESLIDANIQHVQIDNAPHGVILLVNGEPVPSLAWDGESLVTTAETLETFGMSITLLDKILPLVRNLGMGVTVRIPLSPGVDLIPQLVEGDSTAAAASKAAQEAFLESIGTPPQIHASVDYDAEGNWELAGISGLELAALGVPPESLAIPPDMLQSLSDMGVKSMGLATGEQGIFIVVNDKKLPHISWENGEIVHVLNLAAQMGLLDDMAPGTDMGDLLVTIEAMLPAIQVSEISLTANFP